MIVRAAEKRDAVAWGALRFELWPDEDAAALRAEVEQHFQKQIYDAVFVAEENGVLVGFVEADLRSVAEGCRRSPAPFIEGWYVAPQARRKGVGRALIRAVEDWGRARGFTELASDTQLWNTASQTAHAKLGFEEVERLVAFRKDL